MIAASRQRFDTAALRALETNATVLLAQGHGLGEAYKPIAEELRGLERVFAQALPRHFHRGEPLELVANLADSTLNAAGISRGVVSQALTAREECLALNQQIAATQEKAARASQLVSRCRAWLEGKAT